MTFLKVLTFSVLAALSAARAEAQGPERKDVRLGVGGAPALYYLPLTLTDRLGYFKEQGLNVEINDFKGGSQSLTALVGGSADVVTGAYEHTLRMQAKGQDIVAIIELGRYPGIALGVKKDRADKIKSVADLKGAKIGVTAPGSSTNMIVWYLMAKAGLKPDDASFIGVGTGAGAVAVEARGVGGARSRSWTSSASRKYFVAQFGNPAVMYPPKSGKEPPIAPLTAGSLVSSRWSAFSQSTSRFAASRAISNARASFQSSSTLAATSSIEAGRADGFTPVSRNT